MFGPVKSFSIIFLLLLCFVGCGVHDSDHDGGDDDALPDDGDSSDDDESDDDSAADDDEADDDTDDDVDDDTVEDGPAQWCRSLGTIPEDTDWHWTTRVLARLELGGFSSWVAYSGETLWVHWEQYDLQTEEREIYLSKYEDGIWTDYPLWVDTNGASVGLSIDSAGRPWTVYVNLDCTISPKAMSLIRWDDGEIAEILPVDDVGITQFYQLFTLPDGRFLIYLHYGVPRAIYQTDDGFVMTYPNFDTSRYVPDRNGVMHVVGVESYHYLVLDSGSDSQSYRTRYWGRSPEDFNPAVGRPWTAVDSAGTVHYIGILNDYRIWHLWKDGMTLQSETWSDSLEEFVYPHYIAGVDELDLPFLSFGTCTADKPVACFVRREDEGIRAEVMDEADLYGCVNIYNDYAVADSGRIAFSSLFDESDDIYGTNLSVSLKVSIRE